MSDKEEIDRNNDEIALLPKVKLHVHLEGAIRPATVMHMEAQHPKKSILCVGDQIVCCRRASSKSGPNFQSDESQRAPTPECTGRYIEKVKI